MDISVQQAGIQTVEAEAIIVNLFEGVIDPGGATGVVDKALDGTISEVIASGDFTGKLGDTVLLYPRSAIPARRVIVVGLGEADELSLERVREAAGKAIKAAKNAGARQVATIIHGGGVGGLDLADAAQAIAEGSLLALYRYAAPGREKAKAAEKETQVEVLSLVEFDESKISAIESGVRIGQTVAEGVTLARDLVNQPSNVMTSAAIAEAAQNMCDDVGLSCRILDVEALRKEGMNVMLAVGQGSKAPEDRPRLVVMEHKPGDTGRGPIVLVGKGVAFDTGGYTLKSSSGMVGMKGDMGGAAAVIGAMRVIAQLGLPVHVIGLTPLVENLVSDTAYKPNDVFVAKNGVSVEIISTDAEGRLILADTLCYADTLKPSAVIDVATLTGGKTVALGMRTSALFATDDSLCDALLAAGKEVGEPLWRMPLDQEYDAQLRSDAADFKNTGGRYASAVTAACFLFQFTGEWPWAHIDIAGGEFNEGSTEDTPRSYVPKGATGLTVRTLVAYLRAIR